MDIRQAYIGQKVKIVKEGVITGIYDDCMIKMTNADQLGYTERAQYVEPIGSDVCESCQIQSKVAARDLEIVRLQAECEKEKLKAFWDGRKAERRASEEKMAEWKTTAQEAYRNAAYWREELTKLQKEALTERDLKEHGRIVPNGIMGSEMPCHFFDELKPLGEVAKIYIQISPAVLTQIMKGE